MQFQQQCGAYHAVYLFLLSKVHQKNISFLETDFGSLTIKNLFQEPTNDIFDQAQKQIFNLMKFDSYPRFLKSDIYKHCLAGDFQKLPTDPRLLINPSCTSPSKLKKSVSNAEDRRRKSLLPWNRKHRSKSKDRGESEYVQKQSNLVISGNCNGIVNEKHEIHSSDSSLTSLDLATAYQVRGYFNFGYELFRKSITLYAYKLYTFFL